MSGRRFPRPSSVAYPIAKAALRRLPAWLLRWRPFGIYQRRLAQKGTGWDPECGSDAAAGVRCEWTTPSVLSQYPHLTADELLDAWDPPQCRAALAWSDGLPVGIAWIAQHRFREQELGIAFDLADDEAWLFAAHVIPAFRNQGIYRQLLGFLLNALRDEGKQRLLFGIASGNRASRHAHGVQDQAPVGRLVAVRVLGLTTAMASGACHRQSTWPFAWKQEIRYRVASSR